MPEIDNWTVDHGTQAIQAKKAGDFAIPLSYIMEQSISDTWHRFGYAGFVDTLNQEKLKHASMVVDPNTDEDVPNKFIDAKEAQDRFGISIHAGSKISEFAAENMQTKHNEYLYRQETLARAPHDFGSQAAIMGATFASQFLDPINLGAGFIPFIGQAREAQVIGGLGKVLGRAAVGGIEGALGNAILEPLNWATSKEFGYDYSAMDSFTNVAVGAALGGIARPVLGAVSDAFSTASRSHFVNHIDPEVHAEAAKVALGQMLNGQRVEVAPLVRLAIDEKYPHLRDLSAIKFVKSAADSASIFEHHINEVEGMIKFQDELKMLLTDSEQKVVGMTHKENINEAQIALGHDINELKDLQTHYHEAVLKAGDHEARTELSTTLASITQEIEEKQSALSNLTDTRRLVAQNEETLAGHIDNFSQARADLQIPDEHNDGRILNIEQTPEGQRLVGPNLSEPDKELMRKAILAAQDLNKIPEMTHDKLLELATNLSSTEGQWHYAPEITQEITENAKLLPKEYDAPAIKEATSEIEKQLQQMQQTLKDNDIEFDYKEELAKFDENIADANKYGKVLLAAGQCLLENT